MRIHSSAICLGTSSIDRYRAFLVSGVLISGLLAGLMALLFMLQMERDHQPSPNLLIFNANGYLHEDEPDDHEFEEPKPSDVEDVTNDMESVVEALTDALSNNPALANSVTGDGWGESRRRPPRGPDRTPRKPLAESTSHWVLSFSIASKADYLQQVDDLKIELGYVSKIDSKIDYVSEVATVAPIHRVGERADERRHLFLTSSKVIHKWHEKVFKGLGVETYEKISARFFPNKLIQQLKQLETDHLEKQGIAVGTKIRRTLFGLRRDGGKWKFYIVDIAL